jgi:hypothetical protein
MSSELIGKMKVGLVSFAPDRERFLILATQSNLKPNELCLPYGDNFEFQFETPEQTASRVLKTTTSLDGHCFHVFHGEVGEGYTRSFFTCVTREQVGPDWVKRMSVKPGESLLVGYYELEVFWYKVCTERGLRECILESLPMRKNPERPLASGHRY